MMDQVPSPRQLVPMGGSVGKWSPAQLAAAEHQIVPVEDTDPSLGNDHYMQAKVHPVSSTDVMIVSDIYPGPAGPVRYKDCGCHHDPVPAGRPF